MPDFPPLHHVTAAFRGKLTIICIALVGLTSAVEPAAARMTSCQIKHSYCSERCIMNNNGEGKINACISRTCDHQHRGCGPESLGDAGGKGKGKGRAGLVAQPVRVGAPAPQPAQGRLNGRR